MLVDDAGSVKSRDPRKQAYRPAGSKRKSNKECVRGLGMGVYGLTKRDWPSYTASCRYWARIIASRHADSHRNFTRQCFWNAGYCHSIL